MHCLACITYPYTSDRSIIIQQLNLFIRNFLDVSLSTLYLYPEQKSYQLQLRALEAQSNRKCLRVWACVDIATLIREQIKFYIMLVEELELLISFNLPRLPDQHLIGVIEICEGLLSFMTHLALEQLRRTVTAPLSQPLAASVKKAFMLIYTLCTLPY